MSEFLFGIRLKQYRTNNHLSQQELADIIGTSKQVISRYESSQRSPKISVVAEYAQKLGVDISYFTDSVPDAAAPAPDPPVKKGYLRIPVLGTVRAGIPAEAVEDIIDWEDIPQSLARGGECVGLKVRGDSMEPRICDGDVVIVRRQADCQSGELAVVIVNGDEATVKRIKKRPEGLMLSPSNPAYEPFFYTNDEIEALPVTIYGKVVELRAKF